MMSNILLASHGSPGAIAAEEVAIGLSKPEDVLHHLYVIPSWWSEITGDDWLNNGISRNRFRSYVESELGKESDETINRIKQRCKKQNTSYRLHIVIGNSEKTFVDMVGSFEYAKIFIGESRPEHLQGLNDKMLTRKVRINFKNQLIIIPHPNG